ncbi:MAG: hypothetical protein NW217_06450 [Hyphomicrobiaceae bacterium]|nr:hypothetical protein [Hyphomicrobiaceae bacterium]
MKPAAASTKSAARPADAGRTLSREQLVEGYGLPLSRFGVFEALGIIVSDGDDGFRCDDDDRLIIAAAAVQLGFDERELGELMELYDNTSPQDRALPRFMKLLASYQRLMAWRHPEGCDPETLASLARRPFRAEQFGFGESGKGRT